MNTLRLSFSTLVLALASAGVLACSDDTGGSESGSETAGDGDGDAGDGDGDTADADAGDGDGDTGDGDGDTGDGDGDTGDGDGDTGDGDGDTGDGDGDTGDGDGDTGDGDGDGDGDCAAMDAMGEGPCDQFFGWAWNGVTCVGISGCDCVGPDCNALYQELEACEAAFADCTQPDGCAALTEAQCLDTEDCMPANGAALIETNQGFCLEQPDFVACIDAGLCGQAFTWGCDPGDDAYYFPNTCLPDDFDNCEPPVDDPQPCE